MTSEKPVDDQILIDLFLYRHEHGSTGMKLLTEYSQHSHVIARLVEHGDILHVGEGYFHITTQGQRRIAAKYPELWDATRPPYLRYERKPREGKKPGRKGTRRWGRKGE